MLGRLAGCCTMFLFAVSCKVGALEDNTNFYCHFQPIIQIKRHLLIKSVNHFAKNSEKNYVRKCQQRFHVLNHVFKFLRYKLDSAVSTFQLNFY